MHSKRMMAVGAVMMAAALGIFIFGFVILGEKDEAFERAIPYDGTPGGAGEGDLVVIEGKVSARNKILVHDFVDAAKEHQVKGGSWSILETYRQPILVDLAGGELLLTSETICTEAKGNNILMADEKSSWDRPVRYIGLKRGDPVTAVGTLIKTNPAAMTVEYWYSGTAAEHRASAASGGKGLQVFCLLVALMGAGLFIGGFKSR